MGGGVRGGMVAFDDPSTIYFMLIKLTFLGLLGMVFKKGSRSIEV